MKDYKETTEQIDVNYKGCISCKHCYIPEDFMIGGISKAETYCNITKDQPLSGDILN